MPPGLDALGLGETADVFGRRGVELDDALGVTGTDRELLHVDIGGVQQRAAIGHRHGGDRARHVLGAQRGAFEWVDRDIDFRTGVHALDLLADEEHRRLVALTFADHDGALDRQCVERAAHRVDGGLVGWLLLPVLHATAADDTAARSVTRTISSVRMRSSNACGGTEIWVDIGSLLLETFGTEISVRINSQRVQFVRDVLSFERALSGKPLFHAFRVGCSSSSRS